MKKICFLIGSLDNSGGTERVTTLIANELSRRLYDISILSIVGGENPFFTINHDISVRSIYKEKISFKSNYLDLVFKIRKYLKGNKIETLIVVDSISCVFTIPAVIGLKIKHICWEHFNFNVNLGVKYRDIGRKWAARYCDYVVTLTARDKELWGKGLKIINAKLISIPNPSPYSIQQSQPSIGNKTILCVGRLTHIKGFDLMIKAWARVHNRLEGWKVVFVGTGEDESMLKDMVINYSLSNSIVFVGQQENMGNFYKEASFVCMSSRSEGLPMVLLEAQSYRLPIVSFDCDTGPAELVNSDNGILVPNGNIDKLAEAIFEMANFDKDLYQKTSNNSALSASFFNLEKICCKWEKVLC